jgi:hypothetical protein
VGNPKVWLANPGKKRNTLCSMLPAPRSDQDHRSGDSNGTFSTVAVETQKSDRPAQAPAPEKAADNPPKKPQSSKRSATARFRVVVDPSWSII